jgi:hypothetical protein
MSFDRSQIRKGMFLTSTPRLDDDPPRQKRALPADLRQFEATVAAADRLAELEQKRAAGTAEVKARLDAAQQRLETIKAIAAKRRQR